MQAAPLVPEITLPPWLASLARVAERSPIAVRQLRQQLRSRSWSITLVAVPILCALAALTCLAWADHQRTWNSALSPSRLLFGGYLLLWGVICGVVQPGAAGRSLRRERLEETWDLIELTGLGGQAIAFGHWCAAVLQILLMSSLFAPFLVMAWLLRGVDTVSLLTALIGVPAWGLLMAAIAIFGATAPPPKKKSAKGVGIGVEFLSLILGWPVFFGLMQLDGVQRLLSGLGGGLLAPALAATAWALVVTASLVQAGTALTHPARNRSTGPRLVSCITALLVALWGFLLAPFASIGLASAAIVILAIALWTGLSAIAEFDGTTSRQQRWIDEARGFWQRTAWFLGPGCRRGRRCVLLLTALGLICALASGQGPILRGGIAIVAYAYLCFLLGDFFARLKPSAVHRPRLQSVLTVVIALLVHALGVLVIWLTGSKAIDLMFLLPLGAISLCFDGKADATLMTVISLLALITISIMIAQACRRENRTIRIVSNDALER